MDLDELAHAESYRDRVSTVTEKGARNWVYALKPHGKFYNYRIILTVIYLLVFFSIPFIKVNGMPFVMFNVLEGKFILFSKIFWPQDFYIFAIAMITFIIFIALFTVVYGRLFCGWVCPQTIFMEMVFRPLEWLIEGNPAAQKQLNNGPWNFTKVWKKSLKHFIYFVISFLIAHTFLSYILGVDKVIKIIEEPLSEHVAMFIGLIAFAFAFYGVFAYVREIVCTTICPYGRLQGVMFDKDTMLVAYDYKRGEDRAKFKKNEQRTAGDCIDCHQCVNVCPTGIDIRNGTQLDCVGCTACIDACDFMMDKVGLPKGLIRYASENGIAEGKKLTFTPRIKAYSVLLVILLTILTVLMITRNDVDTHITRTGGQLYQELPDHKLSNLYNAKIINKTNSEFPVELKLENAKGEIKLVGKQVLSLKKESIHTETFFIILDKTEIHDRTTKLKVGVYKDGKKIQTVKTNFLGPFM
ncbi:MAG TPA: cytochrome c oxidase accessory protein CcoG [Saprospiraceae bacterium]|nr:cytochrome c oxidase accessory protein CcoG [Saprospiraceae bacterium]